MARLPATPYPLRQHHLEFEEMIFYADPPPAYDAVGYRMNDINPVPTNSIAITEQQSCSQQGANIDARNREQWTALIFAAQSNAPNVFYHLFRELKANLQGCDPEKWPLCPKKAYLQSLLGSYALNGSYADVKQLLNIDGQLDVNWRDGNTYTSCLGIKVQNATALHLATMRCTSGRSAIVGLLIDAKADVNLTESKLNYTALNLAALSGDTVAVEQLINYGAKINARGSGGTTALLTAAVFNMTEIAKLLIQKGADFNARNSDGASPLMEAAKRGYYAVMDLLLDKGAQIDLTDNGGQSALILAAAKGQTDSVTLLLDRGAQIDFRRKDMKTALNEAGYYGHISTVKLLLDRGANVCLTDSSNYTILIWTVAGGNLNTVEQLINYGANINARSSSGYTALMTAAAHNSTEIAKLLIQKGADVNAKDNSGETALMKAANLKSSELINLLLGFGAKPDGCDRNRWPLCP